LKLKKFITNVLIVILSLTVFVGCSNNKSDENTIRIGVSPRPHKELIEFIKEDLEAEGINHRIY